MIINKFFFKLFLRNFKYINYKSTQNIKSIQTFSIKSLHSFDDFENSSKLVRVIGWVKSYRNQKEIKFVHLNDGSDCRNLQLVFLMENFKEKNNKEEILSKLNLNTSIEVIGNLVKSSNRKQNIEMRVSEIKIIGECDPNSYPFKLKANYTLEQIRPNIHLRSHIDKFANIMRFRSELTYCFHEFLNNNSFIQIHTPILTANNCEGGCETFEVVTNEVKTNRIEDCSENENILNLKKTDNSDSGFFFSQSVYLTASAQLHLETMTTTLAKVYTLSPTFRAEKSLTRHHLAEFYMLECELIDMNNLDQLLDFVEKLVKEVSVNVYRKFDKNFLESISKPEDHLKQTKSNKKIGENQNFNYSEFILNSLTSKQFIRLKYKEAIQILNHILAGKKEKSVTKTKIEFGDDMNKEQEKLLVDYFNQTPVFITNYPKSLKPFYMRQNDQEEDLVDNFDLLAPNVGEIVGGSLREYRLNVLIEAMKKQNLDVNKYKNYLETKKYGAMKMGGFGLGLERFIQFLLNIENIRDVCAFPRNIYNCKM